MTEQPFQQPQQAPVPQQSLAQAATGPSIESDFAVLDLDLARKQRAAAREGRREPLPVRIGGQTIAVLPVELPINVLEPLRSLDSDLTLILRSSMDAMRARDTTAVRDAGEIVVDVLAANPNLPVAVLDTISDVARRLLGQDGLNALMAAGPSTDDLAALSKGVFRFYGVTLGEASAPSGSSTSGGATSNTTSGPTSESTSATSTPSTIPSATSESVAS